MTDAEFLASYNPSAFPPLAVATDVACLSEREGALRVLLVRRSEPPARGRLALPGVFVRVDEELEHAAQRALRDKAGVDAPVRQFQAFGAVGRDPRMRIVSIGFMALIPPPERIADGVEIATWTPRGLRGANGRKVALAFDHDAILAAALADLRFHLDHSSWSFGLLRPEFTLRELQIVHEAIRGETLNKPAFRKRLLESGKLEPVGRKETGGPFRPAELYRVRWEAFGG